MVTFMGEHQNKSYRYERKFIIEQSRLNDLLSSLYSSSYNEKYSERRINNIYYDDYNFSAVSENLDGLSERKKYRVRWYGEIYEKSNKVLETKVKNEFLTLFSAAQPKSFREGRNVSIDEGRE